MKKRVVFLLIFMFLCSFSAFGQEENDQALIDTTDMRYDKSPVNKLGRGLLNTVTCFVEIPAEAVKVSQEKDPLTGCTLGVVEGFLTAILRGLSGVYDTVTFLIPPYNKPLMQPEYALQSAFEKCKEIKKE